MRRMSSCVPVIPQGSRYYDIPYLSENELIPTTRKSQVLRETQLLALERPIYASPKDQVAYLNNMARETSTFTLKGKTPTQLREEAFEIEFLERTGNQLFLKWNEGEISEDEFFREVAKERRLLRLELGQTPTEGETTETETETDYRQRTLRKQGATDDELTADLQLQQYTPFLINETELELQRVAQELRTRGGARPGAGRMTREEKRLQLEMIAEGRGKPTKTAIKEGKRAVEDILAEVFSRVEV